MRLFILLCFAFILQLSAKEGLQLKLQDGFGKSDYRTSRLAALYNKQSASVSPFLKKGQFTAVFSGVLSLNTRSRVYFKFAGKGKATLKIDGKEVLQASGQDLSTLM
ncbi:MAG: hypothetical protein HRT88_14645, partial [Lentisphaeraceae bacterium]|nr:hypothetical protein [Lentisphaeraceae bacterium]